MPDFRRAVAGAAKSTLSGGGQVRDEPGSTVGLAGRWLWWMLASRWSGFEGIVLARRKCVYLRVEGIGVVSCTQHSVLWRLLC